MVTLTSGASILVGCGRTVAVQAASAMIAAAAASPLSMSVPDEQELAVLPSEYRPKVMKGLTAPGQPGLSERPQHEGRELGSQLATDGRNRIREVVAVPEHRPSSTCLSERRQHQQQACGHAPSRQDLAASIRADRQPGLIQHLAGLHELAVHRLAPLPSASGGRRMPRPRRGDVRWVTEREQFRRTRIGARSKPGDAEPEPSERSGIGSGRSRLDGRDALARCDNLYPFSGARINAGLDVSLWLVKASVRRFARRRLASKAGDVFS